MAQQKWFQGDTISVSNGSGYNSYTPLQIAHAVANLANNGVVMKPHLVKSIEDGSTRARTLTVAKESYRIPLRQENIDIIKRAMVGVTSEVGGTALKVFAGAPYTVGGKTGTAQVIAIKKNEKYNAKLIAERLRDNALFTAFAPADKPRIALAIVVENGGFGATTAVPIARKALDFYLLGKRPNEKDTTKVPKEDAEALRAVEEIDEEQAANAEPKPAPAPTPVPAPAAPQAAGPKPGAAPKPGATAPAGAAPAAPPNKK